MMFRDEIFGEEWNVQIFIQTRSRDWVELFAKRKKECEGEGDKLGGGGEQREIWDRH